MKNLYLLIVLRLIKLCYFELSSLLKWKLKLLLNVFSGDTSTIVVVLAMVGKFAITCSYSMIYVYATEVFPTVVRTLGLGMCSFMSRIGGIIAPYAAEMVSQQGHPRKQHSYNICTMLGRRFFKGYSNVLCLLRCKRQYCFFYLLRPVTHMNAIAHYA